MDTKITNPFLDQNLEFNRKDPFRIVYQPQTRHTADEINTKYHKDRLIHGAVVTALGQEAAWSILDDDTALTMGLQVDFLQPTLLTAGPVTALGELIRLGSKVHLSVARVYQEHSLVAFVRGSFRTRR